jgi:hypothetical protein
LRKSGRYKDLALPGMAVNEFWQNDDKDYAEFEYENSLVPKQVHVKLPKVMGKFHE